MSLQNRILSQFPTLALLSASPMIFNQLFKIIFDQQLVESDPYGQGPRKLVILTAGINQAVAKVKARVYVASLRPKRKITDLQLSIVEQGPVVKLYQAEISTDLLGGE